MTRNLSAQAATDDRVVYSNATRERRCRSLSTGQLGTILDTHGGNGWMTILFDGAPCPVDLWAPLTRGLIEVL